jgi:hypothetical protein
MAPNPKPPSHPAVPAAAPLARPAFPLEALGPPLAAAASAVADRTQAPPELIAHHLLTLAAMPAQRLVSVRLPTGLVQPVSSYFLTLVGSGEGRSAAQRMCLDPVRVWDRRFTAAAAMVDEKGRPLEKHSVVIDLRAPDSDIPETEKNVLRFGFYAPAKNGAPAPSPNSVEVGRVFLSPVRSTTADRYDRYARFGRRSGLFAGLAAELLTPSSARRNEADSLSALWDGGAVGNGVEGAESAALAPRLSVHLVATPGEGLALLRAPELAASGLLGRLLTVQPASRIGARAFTAHDGAPPAALQALHARLTDLYAREATDDSRVLGLDDAATAMWFAFAAEAEAAMAPGGAYEFIRPLAGHLAEHAVRLSAIIALIEDDALTALTPALLARGIALARFYADEALRLLDVRVPPREGRNQVAALQSWLARKHAGGEITLRDICHAGPPVVRTPAEARRAMREIEMIGLAVRAPRDGAAHGNAGERWTIAAPEIIAESVARSVA